VVVDRSNAFICKIEHTNRVRCVTTRLIVGGGLQVHGACVRQHGDKAHFVRNVTRSIVFMRAPGGPESTFIIRGC
jgi:hypothetical protein